MLNNSKNLFPNTYKNEECLVSRILNNKSRISLFICNIRFFWYFEIRKQSQRLKKFKKIRLRSILSLDFIYGLRFRIQAACYFPQSWVQKTGFILYLLDFHGRNWRIPGFCENKTQHWAWFSNKTNQGCFIFIGPNSLSRAEYLAAVNHVTQAVARVALQICKTVYAIFLTLRNTSLD